MPNNHVGIAKSIEKGFSMKKHVFEYDWLRDSLFSSNIDNLGVEKNYYNRYVEKDILANGIEKKFSTFYYAFCSEKNSDGMVRLLLENKELFSTFFSFMFMRSKKSLEIVNKYSLTRKAFGDVSHSELLEFQCISSINCFDIIGKDYFLYPLINCSNHPFINNSIGFCFIYDKNSQPSCIIPMNSGLAVWASSIRPDSHNYYFIESQNDVGAININKSLCQTEIAYGNGFIFGRDKIVIEKYKKYIQILNSNT